MLDKSWGLTVSTTRERTQRPLSQFGRIRRIRPRASCRVEVLEPRWLLSATSTLQDQATTTANPATAASIGLASTSKAWSGAETLPDSANVQVDDTLGQTAILYKDPIDPETGSVVIDLASPQTGTPVVGTVTLLDASGLPEQQATSGSDAPSLTLSAIKPGGSTARTSAALSLEIALSAGPGSSSGASSPLPYVLRITQLPAPKPGTAATPPPPSAIPGPGNVRIVLQRSPDVAGIAFGAATPSSMSLESVTWTGPQAPLAPPASGRSGLTAVASSSVLGLDAPPAIAPPSPSPPAPPPSSSAAPTLSPPPTPLPGPLTGPVAVSIPRSSEPRSSLGPIPAAIGTLPARSVAPVGGVFAVGDPAPPIDRNEAARANLALIEPARDVRDLEPRARTVVPIGLGVATPSPVVMVRGPGGLPLLTTALVTVDPAVRKPAPLPPTEPCEDRPEAANSRAVLAQSPSRTRSTRTVAARDRADRPERPRGVGRRATALTSLTLALTLGVGLVLPDLVATFAPSPSPRPRGRRGERPSFSL